MVDVLESLIDKQDGFQLVRDQVALVLAEETVNQQALAVTAGKDPLPWTYKVFTERSNPFEDYLSKTTPQPSILNVWFRKSDLLKSASNLISTQQMRGDVVIDVYGLGLSQPDGSGQLLGDELAARNCQNTMMLIRNILMSALNYQLQISGVVVERSISSFELFQIQGQQNDQAAQSVLGGQVRLNVGIIEQSPQITGGVLQEVLVEIKRDSDGAIIAAVEKHY